jgi:HSP20 family protein
MATNGKEQGVAVRERRPLGLWPDELDRFFDRAMRGFRPRRRFLRGFPALWREVAWMPDMDVFEREGKTVVRLDLPGIKREDITVEVQDDTLVISGHREEEKEVKEEHYYCAERATGEFSRAITLPEGVTADAIEATYHDGILEVVVPKPAAAEKPPTTKVPVK